MRKELRLIIKKITSQILLLALAGMLILGFAPNLQSAGSMAAILIIFVVAILLWFIDKFIEYRYHQNKLLSEKDRWGDDLSIADTIFDGLEAMDLIKIANKGTTREIDEIIDFQIEQNPNVASNLMTIFEKARDISAASQSDLETKEQVREFLACFFATSGASHVRSLLLEQGIRKQLFASAKADTNVYVRTQLVRALAKTIQKSDSNACTEFVKEFIKDNNVLVSGYAYVFSKECTGLGLEDLESAWVEKYTNTDQYNLHKYLSSDSRRLRYMAAGLGGYVTDRKSKKYLQELTEDKYDYVRACARVSLAQLQRSS